MGRQPDNLKTPCMHPKSMNSVNFNKLERIKEDPHAQGTALHAPQRQRQKQPIVFQMSPQTKNECRLVVVVVVVVVANLQSTTLIQGPPSGEDDAGFGPMN